MNTKRFSGVLAGGLSVALLVGTAEAGWLDAINKAVDTVNRVTNAVEAVKENVFNSTFIDEIELYVYCGNEASRNVALKCGFYPDYSRYKENVRSAYGTVESEERFTITRGDFEWEQRGCSTFSSAA